MNVGAAWLGLALVVAVAGQVLLDSRIDVPAGIVLCVLAVALATISLRGGDDEAPRPTWTRREAAWLGLLLALALVVRLAANGDYPLGVSYDEAANALEARDLLASRSFPIWSDNLSGRPTLHLHILAGAFALFGVSAEVLRAVSAVFGALTVGALYLLARHLGGVAVAFAAAGFLAVSRWHLSYSRIGYEAILGPLCAALAMYFLLRGLRDRRLGWFAASGFVLGTGMYTYIAFRLLPLALVPAGIVAVARAARRGESVRPILAGFAVAIVTAVLVTLPLLEFARSDWDRFAGRFNEVSIFAQVRETRSYQPLIENTLRHLGMLNYRGGIRAATNLPGNDAWQPGAAMLSLPFAILFLLGLGRTIRRAGTPGGALLLGTLFSSLLAGLLTRVEEGPHQTRSLVAIVVAAYFAGDALIALLSWLRERAPVAARSAPLVAGLVVAGTGVFEGVTYWKQLNHPEAWWDFIGGANAVGRFLRATPRDAQLYVSSSLPDFPAGAIVELQSGLGAKQMTILRPVEHVPARVTGRDVVYVLTPEDYEAFKWGIGVAYPEATWHEERDPFERLLFASMYVPKEIAASTLGLRAASFADAGCAGPALDEALESSSAPFGAAPAAAGAQCRQWVGVIYVPASDRYRIVVDDGSGQTTGLWIDGQEVGAEPVALAKGFASIRVRRRASAPLPWRLRWARAAAAPTAVPADAIFARRELSQGLIGYYYPNAAFRAPARVIQRDWTFFPNSLAGTPQYSIAWRGALIAPVDGPYRFTSGGDEGTQLIIDEQLILSTDIRAGRPNAERTIPLTKGRHDVEMRYFKSQGMGQSMLFTWQPPGREPERLGASAFEPVADPLWDEPRNAIPAPRS